MFTLTVILFALAALGGITLATLHLRHKPLPMALALVHGIVAAVALILLIVAVAGGGLGTLTTVSLILFIVAALGGFVLFATYLRHKPLPTPLVYVHGLVAVIAFILLIV